MLKWLAAVHVSKPLRLLIAASIFACIAYWGRSNFKHDEFVVSRYLSNSRNDEIAVQRLTLESRGGRIRAIIWQSPSFDYDRLTSGPYSSKWKMERAFGSPIGSRQPLLTTEDYALRHRDPFNAAVRSDGLLQALSWYFGFGTEVAWRTSWVPSDLPGVAAGRGRIMLMVPIWFMSILVIFTGYFLVVCIKAIRKRIVLRKLRGEVPLKDTGFDLQISQRCK